MADAENGVAGDVDRQLAAAGLEKRRAGRTPSARETAAIRRLERAREGEAQERAYAAIPLALWRSWSGLHDREIKKVAADFGLPIEGPTIALPPFVKAFHVFIDEHRYGLSIVAQKPAGKRPRLGARTKLSNKHVLILLEEAIAAGLSNATACERAGVSTASFYVWLRAGEDAMRQVANRQRLSKEDSEALHFLDIIKKARAEFEFAGMQLIGKAATDGTWQAKAWQFERTRPEKYALHRREGHEMADDPDTMWEDAALLMAIMEGTMRGIDAPPGVLPSVWKTHFWTPAQMALLDSDARINLVACGRGSGKTEMLLRRLVKALGLRQSWDNPLYFYAAPTNPQAMRIAWDRIGKLIPPHWLRHARTSKQYYETIFGSRLYVLGMDKPKGIEGPQWDGGGMDECSDQRPDAFNLSVYPALAHRNAWCWRTGVPKRVGIGATQFHADCDAATAGQIAETRSHAWPSADILPPEVIINARAMLDPKDFREQFEASWETAGGGIFWAFELQENVRPCPYAPTGLLAISCDFNVDPMCWTIARRYRGRVEWIDEIFERNTNTRAVLDILWGRYSSHTGGFEFFGDASSKARKTSAEFTDYAQIHNDKRFWPGKTTPRIYILDANPPVGDRFAACNAMFLNADGERRMFVDPHCTHLIDDLTARHYKPGTNEPADSGDLGHMTDAMGYLIMRCYPIAIDLADLGGEVILPDRTGRT